MSLHNPPAPQSTASENSIAGRILQLRQMQSELRSKPVTGTTRAIKRLFYKAVRSTFWRQFNINSATLDLVEAMYRELADRAPTEARPAATAPANSMPESVSPATNTSIAIPTGEVLASCGQTQDQAKLNNIRPLTGFNAVYSSPAEMRMTERVALYSLIFGMQPKNCLEIGTFRGGSSAIICGAMDDTGFGQLACVDPMMQVDPALWSKMSNRCRMFEGNSPDILPEVARQIKAPFDFVLIDGCHYSDAVSRDIAGVLPHLADTAYVLFHDANHGDVKRAIDKALAESTELTDCGMVSSEPTVLYQDGQAVTWAGLRLLRFQRRAVRARAA